MLHPSIPDVKSLKSDNKRTKINLTEQKQWGFTLANSHQFKVILFPLSHVQKVRVTGHWLSQLLAAGDKVGG